MFGNSQMMGLDLGFPDVCLTPPVPAPIPYPDIGLGPQGSPPASKILFMCTPAHNLGTKYKPTNGDNGGQARGVVSGQVMAKSRPVTGAFTVLLQGKPASRMTSVNIQNSINCPGARIVPSQVKVLLLAP